MKAHHEKCHLLLSTHEETNIQVSGTTNKALNVRGYLLNILMAN